MMTPEQLALLTPEEKAAWERCERATADGGWTAVNKSVRTKGSTDPMEGTRFASAPNGFAGGICNCLGAHRTDSVNHRLNVQARDNAAFIAHSRADLPTALETIAELRREKEELRTADWVKQVMEETHANKLRHGWKVTTDADWSDTREIPSALMLIVTEVSEAMEAFRHDDKANFREELADVFIRLVGLCHGMGIDIRAEVLAKVEKNHHREIKHGGKRL